MSFTATQRLLVVAALVWALLPDWGGPVFAVAWVALWAGTHRRAQRARAVFDAHAAQALKALDAETLAFVRAHAFAYLWREAAVAWGVTWRVSSLIAMLLAPWFVIRAVMTQAWWELGLLVPLAVVFLMGGRYGLELQLDEWVEDDRYRQHKQRHGTVKTLLALKAAAGHWPPEPSPDAASG